MSGSYRYSYCILSLVVKIMLIVCGLSTWLSIPSAQQTAKFPYSSVCPTPQRLNLVLWPNDHVSINSCVLCMSELNSGRAD